MKYQSTILLIILTFIGCSSTITDVKQTIDYYGFDFTKYTDQGFLFTPYGQNLEYDAIGILTVVACPEVKKTENEISGKPYSYYVQQYKSGKTTIIPPNRVTSKGETYYLGNIKTEEVIEKLYTKAHEMGADAIIDFEIINTTHKNGDAEIPCVKISGFAIKRK